MKKCTKCSMNMNILEGKTPEGFTYNYYKCKKCGEEIVDMKQLHEVAEKYRFMKKYHAKITKWGLSLGLRIPKTLAKKYGFKDNEEVTLIPEEEGIKIVAMT